MLYIDVTDTLLNWSGPPTGIHRTLIGLATSAANSKCGKICAWRRETDTWHEVPLTSFLKVFAVTDDFEPKILPEEASPEAASKGSRPLHSFLGKLTRLARYVAPHGLVMARRRTKENDLSRLRARNTLDKQEAVYNDRRQELAMLPKLPVWSRGDNLLVPDSTWNQPGFFAALRGHLNRPRVIGFIYDMIQLERPDFVGEQAQEQFRVWASEVARNSAEIVCISKYSARGMQKLVDVLALGSGAPIVRSIKFGNKVDGDLGCSVPGCSMAELPASLRGDSGWIVWLGSVDRRKNLDVVLLALEGLYTSGRLQRKFVVAGRRAGGSEELIHRVRNNPVLRERVVFVDTPSERLVSKLFLGAELLVFSSWSEGYGLPVAEALQHGIPVIASSWTSIPEVSGDLVDYFEPWDSRALSELLERFDTDGDYRRDLRKRAALFVPTDWSETLKDIMHDRT